MNSKEWISEWNNLFPSNIKWNGVNIKSRDEDCEKRMNDFLKRYPEYSKETIFKATKTYLEKQKNENWNYTKRSVYFIGKKGEPSLLSSYCEAIENKPEETEISINNFYNDFI